MSKPVSKNAARRFRRNATLFAALGDQVRLMLLVRLGDGSQHSITQLALGSTITRQAITKHLRVLQHTGLVRGIRRGRESLFQIEPQPLKEAGDALNVISQQRDDALARLKAFVED